MGQNQWAMKCRFLSCPVRRFVRTFVPSNINTQFIQVQGCKKSFPLIQQKSNLIQARIYLS